MILSECWIRIGQCTIDAPSTTGQNAHVMKGLLCSTFEGPLTRWSLTNHEDDRRLRLHTVLSYRVGRHRCCWVLSAGTFFFFRVLWGFLFIIFFNVFVVVWGCKIELWLALAPYDMYDIVLVYYIVFYYSVLMYSIVLWCNSAQARLSGTGSDYIPNLERPRRYHCFLRVRQYWAIIQVHIKLQ